jgi:exodeoxyribonuclease V alpha subunit
MDKLKGIVTSIIKEDKDSGRVFLSVLEEKNDKMYPIKVGAVGLGIKVGDFFSLSGTLKQGIYRNKPTETFQGYQVHPDIPTTSEGNIVFLSMLFENKFNINKNNIEKIVNKYGSYTVKKMYDNPSIVLELLDEPKKNGKEILEIFKEKMQSKEAFDFLENTGLEQKTIDKIIGLWLNDAYKKIKENPYQVTREGVSLKEAEKIANKLKISPNDPRRLDALIVEALRKNEDNGSTFITFKVLIKTIENYKNIDSQYFLMYLNSQISKDLHVSLKEYKVFFTGKNTVSCSHNDFYIKEDNIVKKIIEFYTSGKRHNFDKVKKITDKIFNLPENSKLDLIQKTAVLLCSSEPISILTGGPGTGKSTIMNLVSDIAVEMDSGPLLLAAPTGMAAKRLSETTKRKASTIHRLLKAKEANGKTIFGMNEFNKLPENCVVVLDEASMIDIEIMDALVKAMPINGRIVLVGDPEQLQSIAPGAVLKSLLELNYNGIHFVPSIKLKNIYRSSKEGGIAIGAQEIDNGNVPSFSNNDDGEAHFLESKDEEATDIIMKLMFEKLPKKGFKPVEDITILSPQAPGPAGTWELNKKISSKINPSGKKIFGLYANEQDSSEIPIPRVGDRVMLRENDKENDLINGELGYIINSGKNSLGKYTITVKYDYNNIEIEYPVTKWRQLPLAYAMSIHKSQGSQFQVVIMPMVDSHELMHEKSLLKTGWTRSEKKVYIVGSKDSIQRCLDTNKADERQTLIKELFKKSMEKNKIKEKTVIDWDKIINDAYLINETSQKETMDSNENSKNLIKSMIISKPTRQNTMLKNNIFSGKISLNKNKNKKEEEVSVDEDQKNKKIVVFTKKIIIPKISLKLK